MNEGIAPLTLNLGTRQR